jgi:hypothetical protein
MTKPRAKTIRAAQALYIKLGRGGQWEEECLCEGTLRFGYRETPHELCLNGRWEDVRREREERRGSQGTATSDTTQIRYFYEAGDDTIWVTFARHSLWWCFADPEVRLLSDSSKERSVKGKWSNRDINQRELVMSSLSGSLLAMQGFRGTICTVKEVAYLLARINGTERPETKQAGLALTELAQRLEAVIRTLTWRDFELLIDLLFRHAGWQRVSTVGSTMKAIDLDLISPITQERFGVQVKAKADRRFFEEYRRERLADMQGFAKFYFAVHTPSDDLLGLSTTDTDVELLLPSRIADLAASYGLASWIIEKAR